MPIKSWHRGWQLDGHSPKRRSSVQPPSDSVGLSSSYRRDDGRASDSESESPSRLRRITGIMIMCIMIMMHWHPAIQPEKRRAQHLQVGQQLCRASHQDTGAPATNAQEVRTTAVVSVAQSAAQWQLRHLQPPRRQVQLEVQSGWPGQRERHGGAPCQQRRGNH